MIARLIHWSLAHRLLVLLATAFAVAWGVHSARTIPVDAIPDLSDVQVILRTTWPGQAPQVVEDQVTYPLTTTMLSVPGARTVRGYSLFGESFVYVLFEDGTDLYWARSRVLEYLSQLQGRLPAAAKTALGPDATGVGWIFEYALTDRSGSHDLAELRALQDWFLKYELKTVPDVAEVATVGGFEKQYQVVIDPARLRALRLAQGKVIEAIRRANNETGGSVLEMGEADYMVRARGYLKTLEDFRTIPVGLGPNGTPIRLADVGWVQQGPELRQGISELDGEGEAVGGIIVMRYGKNALATIEGVRRKLAQLKDSLPQGVEIVPVYDRSGLIERAEKNLEHKLIEEFLVVALVCAAFLFHLRSSLVAIVTLPIGVLLALTVMRAQGINANIMSLGGIAIAVGAMVDAAIVMIENAHKKLEVHRHDSGSDATGETHRLLIAEAAAEVGPALFFSLLVITLSFLPVFTLQAQEGRLFAPLAFTKTWAMAAAAGLSVTLVPVLMVLFVRGHIRDESANPLNRALLGFYRPVLERVLRRPKLTLAVALALLLSTAWPLAKVGTEFMPPLDEGDLLYMPTALPGLSAGKAAQLLQLTDRLIKTVPEVQSVFGKAGRADTATDPAPLEMFETMIRFKPQSEWRAGMTTQKLIEELDARLKIPGVGNVWVQPIRNRIDMLATGVKSPVGIKIAGPDLKVIEQLGRDVEAAVKGVRGTTSAFAERVSEGRYIDIKPDRTALSRVGLNIADFQDVITFAVGGENVGETIEGLQRFPINVRYPRELRDSVAALERLPVVTEGGQTVTLGEVARIAITDGPPMIRSENARPAAYVYVDIRGRDLGGYVKDAQRAVAEQVKLPAGYSLSWSGQFEYLERAAQRLRLVVPATLAVILLLLYLTFGRFDEAALIMLTLPFALVGSLWIVYLLGQDLSVASVVGLIALAGVAAEFGVVMLVYLDQAVKRAGSGHAELQRAIMEGAALRVRPKAMTAAVVIAGLLPLFFGGGAGSEVMQRIASPMIGGMITAPLLSMLVLPAAYYLLRRRSPRWADGA